MTQRNDILTSKLFFSLYYNKIIKNFAIVIREVSGQQIVFYLLFYVRTIAYSSIKYVTEYDASFDRKA